MSEGPYAEEPREDERAEQDAPDPPPNAEAPARRHEPAMKYRTEPDDEDVAPPPQD